MNKQLFKNYLWLFKPNTNNNSKKYFVWQNGRWLCHYTWSIIFFLFWTLFFVLIILCLLWVDYCLIILQSILPHCLTPFPWKTMFNSSVVYFSGLTKPWRPHLTDLTQLSKPPIQNPNSSPRKYQFFIRIALLTITKTLVSLCLPLPPSWQLPSEAVTVVSHCKWGQVVLLGSVYVCRPS